MAGRNARARAGLLGAAALLCAAAWLTPACAAAQPVRYGEAALEQRVELFANALDLDARQQVGLRRVLEEQRAELQRIWRDTSIPAARRVGMTRALSERTEDRIRALLNDEQKKKYNAPRPQQAESAVSDTPSVEDWMRRATQR